jgi:trehalose utilization protein
MKITVWNEFAHEKTDDRVRAIYPDGIHMTIARALEQAGYEVRTATLDDPECGLTDEVLDDTDVLFWWGHMKHGAVPDEVVERVYKKVMDGLGLVVLHSGHASKIFAKLCGTSSQYLKWRESGDKEILWVVEQGHPIAEGIDEKIILEHEETYGEHFRIPQPDELVFLSWFTGGEVFRSGCVFKRGRGKIFYFRPGHETCPTYHNPEIQKVLANAPAYVCTPKKTDYKYGRVQPIINPEE